MKSIKKSILLLVIFIFALNGCGREQGNFNPDTETGYSDNITGYSEKADNGENDGSQSDAVSRESKTQASYQAITNNKASDKADNTQKQSENTSAAADLTELSGTDKTADNEQKPTFSLTISCKNAVAYGKRNESGYDKIIPENGIIYQNASLEFSQGEKLLTALKREMKKNKIALNVSGEYVRGINGLSELDCGKNSGWLYKVGGVKPGYSMGKCELSQGLTVEIIYTCAPGDTD